MGEELELGEYEDDLEEDDDEGAGRQGGEGGEAGQAEAEAYTTLYSGAARDFNVRFAYDGHTYYGAARDVSGVSLCPSMPLLCPRCDVLTSTIQVISPPQGWLFKNPRPWMRVFLCHSLAFLVCVSSCWFVRPQRALGWW